MKKAADDYRRFQACFERIGFPRARDRVAWQYAIPFAPTPLVDLAVRPDDGEPAAVYAVAPVSLALDGAHVSGPASRGGPHPVLRDHHAMASITIGHVARRADAC